MSAKRDRPTAEHLMIIFEPNNGLALRGTDINRALLAKGYIHTGKALMDNLKWLIEKGKIVKAGRGLYGIPNVRKDGTRYIIIQQSDNTKKIVECGKLKKDA